MSRPYLLALSAAVASSIYSVIDKVGVQILHPVFYLWLINFWMSLYTGLYLLLRGNSSFLSVWRDSKREILIIAFLQNVGYLLVLMAMQMSKVSYVVAFRQVGRPLRGCDGNCAVERRFLEIPDSRRAHPHAGFGSYRALEIA